MRRLFSIIALLLVIVSVAGCSTGTVGSLGLVALDHTSYARHHRTEMNAIRCGWHSYRAIHDFRHNHKLYGTYQGVMSARSCTHLVHHHR
jgi:hypothetical protein